MQAIQARYHLLWDLKPLNAVYQADFQRLGWPHTQQEFSKFTRLALLSMIVVVGVLSGVEQFLLKSPTNPVFFYILLIVNLLVTVVADFFTLINTERYINDQIDAGLWADLHLQGLSPLEIVHTKYEITRLRVRWLLIAVQILRMSPYFFLIFFVVWDIFSLGFVRESRWWIGITALLGLPFWILFVRYEPRWQLNTLSALGLATAMLVRDSRRAMLIGCITVGLLRIAQGIILWITGAALVDASTDILIALDKAGEKGLLALLLMPIAFFGLHTVARLVVFERAARLFI